MSHSYDFLPPRSRKQRSLQDPSSQCAGPSTWTRYSSGSSSQSNFDSLLDPLDEATLDSDLDQQSASSATLLSRHVTPSPSTNCLLTDTIYASSQPELFAWPSEPLYPLREPGQMTAQRTKRLRARIATVIRSLPATEEDDADERELGNDTGTHKLRRVRGIRDLRRAFRGDNHEPSHFTSMSSQEASKASFELGILASPTVPPLSRSSLHSSLRTLVDSGNSRPQSSGDLKTRCQSAFSSISTSSRSTTKVYSSLCVSRLPHTCLSSDTSLSIFPSKHLVHNPMTPRRASLPLDTPPSHEPGMAVWSCAKISRSAIKHAARRGHTSRRVFSSPMAALSH